MNNISIDGFSNNEKHISDFLGSFSYKNEFSCFLSENLEASNAFLMSVPENVDLSSLTNEVFVKHILNEQLRKDIFSSKGTFYSDGLYLHGAICDKTNELVFLVSTDSMDGSHRVFSLVNALELPHLDAYFDSNSDEFAGISYLQKEKLEEMSDKYISKAEFYLHNPNKFKLLDNSIEISLLEDLVKPSHYFYGPMIRHTIRDNGISNDILHKSIVPSYNCVAQGDTASTKSYSVSEEFLNVAKTLSNKDLVNFVETMPGYHLPMTALHNFDSNSYYKGFHGPSKRVLVNHLNAASTIARSLDSVERDKFNSSIVAAKRLKRIQQDKIRRMDEEQPTFEYGDF